MSVVKKLSRAKPESNFNLMVKKIEILIFTISNFRITILYLKSNSKTNWNNLVHNCTKQKLSRIRLGQIIYLNKAIKR